MADVSSIVSALMEVMKQRDQNEGGGFGFYDESGQACDSLPDPNQRQACTVGAIGRIRDEAPDVLANLATMPKDPYTEAMYRKAELEGEAEGQAKLALRAALEKGDYRRAEQIKRALQPTPTPSGELITGPYQWATGNEEPLIPSAYSSMGNREMAEKIKTYEGMLRDVEERSGRQDRGGAGRSVSDLTRLLNVMATAGAYGDEETRKMARGLYNSLVGGEDGATESEGGGEGGGESPNAINDNSIEDLARIVADPNQPMALRIAAARKLRNMRGRRRHR